MTTSDRPDPTFGISPQALALLQLLGDIEPCYAPFQHDTGRYAVNVDTFPWFNGLERGVGIQFAADANRAIHLVLVFGEASTSDLLFVESWWAPASPNGHRVEDRPEKVTRRLFPSRDFANVIPYITGVMKNFYQDQMGYRELSL